MAVNIWEGKKSEELIDAVSKLAPKNTDFSELAKYALLNCFKHVGWTDEHGREYHDLLEYALYKNEDWQEIAYRSLSNGLIAFSQEIAFGQSNGHGITSQGQPFCDYIASGYYRAIVYATVGIKEVWADRLWAEDNKYRTGVYAIPVPSDKRTVTVYVSLDDSSLNSTMKFAVVAFGYDYVNDHYGDKIQDSGWIQNESSYALDDDVRFVTIIFQYGNNLPIPSITDVQVLFR